MARQFLSPADCHLPVLTLALQMMDFLLKMLHCQLRFLHGCLEHASLTAPSCELFEFGLSSAVLCPNLLADFAVHSDLVRNIDKLHAARFAHPVFMVALGSKFAPVPVSAGESRLIIEAHAYHIC